MTATRTERLIAEREKNVPRGVLTAHPVVIARAKAFLGENKDLGEEKGSAAPLVDKGETIGMALRTRTGTNPMFISPGHLSDIPTAAELVLHCSPRYRLPEPIRLAHDAAGRFVA